MFQALLIEKDDAGYRAAVRSLDLDRLGDISRTVGLEEALALAPQLLSGRVRGRTVADVNQ